MDGRDLKMASAATSPLKGRVWLTAVRFSRAAKTYERYARFQNEMWEETLSEIMRAGLNPRHILDIGMGTGKHAYELAALYPQALIVGFDVAFGMVEYAASARGRKLRRPFILRADLNEMPFKGSSFDAAVSNAVYQRVPHLAKAFSGVREVLRPGGYFFLSLMTKNTLGELRRSFEEACRRVNGASPAAFYGLPTDSAVFGALRDAGFYALSFKRFSRRPLYKDAAGILKWLKAVGASHRYDNWISGLSARRILGETDRIYRRSYSSDGKIYATFEGLIINARRQ